MYGNNHGNAVELKPPGEARECRTGAHCEFCRSDAGFRSRIGVAWPDAEQSCPLKPWGFRSEVPKPTVSVLPGPRVGAQPHSIQVINGVASCRRCDGKSTITASACRTCKGPATEYHCEGCGTRRKVRDE